MGFRLISLSDKTEINLPAIGCRDGGEFTGSEDIPT
jgi:hypothetical protein